MTSFSCSQQPGADECHEFFQSWSLQVTDSALLQLAAGENYWTRYEVEIYSTLDSHRPRFFCSLGEFGIVYKALLKQGFNKGFTEIVAVKTLKGSLLCTLKQAAQIPD